ncbi:MAG: ATP-binding protein [Candidatus Omnitrophica bacterium]|nr:ATP-binding protein [Candidatus Omnitrophota bacterium]
MAIAISNAGLLVELEKTQAEAAQKEKMAVIGTLAAGMAHEIRNPITTIRIFSEYLPDKLKEAGFVDKYKDIVIKEVDKIDHIIQTMIEFSGDDADADIENVSINDAVDGIISLLRLNVNTDGRIQFIKDVSSYIPGIMVNKKEFDEVLMNLGQNAIHAIKGRGVVTFGASKDDDIINVWVKDTGCGMTDDVMGRIFEPFFTTKSKGFGLGLFIVGELVKRNSGKICAESKVGEGTVFKLEFKDRA